MNSELLDMMKQARAMQKTMKKAQKQLARTRVQGQSGGGLVTVTMNGQHDVRKVEIDKSLMEQEHAVLEDLVAAAVNDAVQKVALMTEEKMGGIAANAGLKPPL